MCMQYKKKKITAAKAWAQSGGNRQRRMKKKQQDFRQRGVKKTEREVQQFSTGTAFSFLFDKIGVKVLYKTDNSQNFVNVFHTLSGDKLQDLENL